jgi:hypothetical protein
LGDARAQSGRDPARRGAKARHGGERGLEHAAQRPLPPGVDGTDHTRLTVSQQHRAAVGGQHAQDQARPVGDERIGLGRRVVVPRLRDREGHGPVHLAGGD